MFNRNIPGTGVGRSFIPLLLAIVSIAIGLSYFGVIRADQYISGEILDLVSGVVLCLDGLFLFIEMFKRT